MGRGHRDIGVWHLVEPQRDRYRRPARDALLRMGRHAAVPESPLQYLLHGADRQRQERHQYPMQALPERAQPGHGGDPHPLRAA